MDHKAIQKASDRLRIANNAAIILEQTSNYLEFSDQWYIFVVAAKSIYTILEQGSKTSPQSRQWFGAKSKIRKNDNLLQYLYEARNDDEHGLGSSVALQPEMHEIGVHGQGYSENVRLDGGPFHNVVVSGVRGAAVRFDGALPTGLHVTSLDGKPVLTKHSPAVPILVDVIARGDRMYPPPTSHLGKPIADTSPLGVAKLAVVYLKGLIEEASRLS